MHPRLSFGKSSRAVEVTRSAMVLNNGIGETPHVKRHPELTQGLPPPERFGSSRTLPGMYLKAAEIAVDADQAQLAVTFHESAAGHSLPKWLN
jgi:hypothetical protein